MLNINEIYENPIKSKYYFKYLSYRKNIYSNILNKFIDSNV